jgi:cytochrome b subunit of formate dehydrogenase
MSSPIKKKEQGNEKTSYEEGRHQYQLTYTINNFFFFYAWLFFLFCPANRYLKKKGDLKRMKKKQRKCGRGKESIKNNGKKLERIGYSLHLIYFSIQYMSG